MGYRLLLAIILVHLSISAFTSFGDKNGWNPAPKGRFPWIASIKSTSRSHACSGIVIARRFVLTAANCIEVVGPNPIIVVSPNGVDDNRWSYGVKEVRAEMAHRHPKWTGNISEGHDVALLQIPQEIDVTTPILADQRIQLIPNTKIRGLKIGVTLEMAKFDLVRNHLCPTMPDLAPGTFCAYSRWFSAAPGDSGGPMMIIDDSTLDDDDGADLLSPGRDILAGIISCANHSDLKASGIGCVSISSVHDWIKRIISLEDRARPALPTLVAATLMITALPVAIVGYGFGLLVLATISALYNNGSWGYSVVVAATVAVAGFAQRTLHFINRLLPLTTVNLLH